jgi:hypothetical protein
MNRLVRCGIRANRRRVAASFRPQIYYVGGSERPAKRGWSAGGTDGGRLYLPPAVW